MSKVIVEVSKNLHASNGKTKMTHVSAVSNYRMVPLVMLYIYMRVRTHIENNIFYWLGLKSDSLRRVCQCWNQISSLQCDTLI